MKRLAATVAKRIAHGARIPPALSRYRIVPTIDPLEYAADMATGSIQELFPAHKGGAGLPVNVRSRSDLPEDRGRWRRSFHDVVTRDRRAVSLLSMADCRILAVRSDWDQEHFAVLSPTNRRLTLSGTRWLPEHRQLLTERRTEAATTCANFVWESWYGNYFHWTVRHLPKLWLSKARKIDESIVRPPAFEPKPVWVDSLRWLDLSFDQMPRMESEILRVERLTFVHTLDLNPYMLRAYRDAIVPSASTVRRKIFISRANANYRRLENEADVERLVAAYGYEIVRLEELTFAAQLRLFSEAKGRPLAARGGTRKYHLQPNFNACC